MRVGITGHTKQLGKAIHDHMVALGHEVIGFSRSNGYTIPDDIDRIVAEARQCDLFFNNVHYGITQCLFLEKLHNVVPIVTSGSMGAEFAREGKKPYYTEKLIVQDAHKRLKRKSHTPMLLLRMGYLENFPDLYPIKYSEVLSAVDHWLANPRISIIEFENQPQIYGNFN